MIDKMEFDHHWYAKKQVRIAQLVFEIVGHCKVDHTN